MVSDHLGTLNNINGYRMLGRATKTAKPVKPETDRDKLNEKLRAQRTSLVKTGFLSLKDVQVTSLTALSTQPRVQTLDISNTSFQSLVSLAPQPNLVKIIADNSQLASFQSLDRHPRLIELSAAGTPLAAREHFRIEAVIVLGQRLAVLNGSPVKASERELAKTFPKIVKYLLEYGWTLDLSTMGEAEYRQIAASLGVQVNDQPFDKLPSAEAKGLFAMPPVYARKSRRDEEREAKEFKQESLGEATRKEERDEAELLGQVADVLESVGIFVDRGDGIKDELLTALQGLTDVVKTLENPTDPQPEEDVGDEA
jgi:hypothetical protein